MIVRVIGWTFVVALIAFGLYTASQPGTGPDWRHGWGRAGEEDRYCRRHDCE